VVLKILDTAGIRQSDNLIETLGIQKTIETVAQADLVIYLLDGTEPTPFQDPQLNKLLQHKTYLTVYNKKDLLSVSPKDGLWISAKHKEIQPLIDAMMVSLGLQEANYHTPSFSNARQIGRLKQTLTHLVKAVEDAQTGLTSDLISSSLQLAYYEIISLLGLEGKADIHSEIFSRFCVGK
jgi:tRNA modification GTPase